MAENEKELFAKASGGDNDAFERLIIPYEKLIYSIAYRMFGNAEDASDISQESFIKIYRGMKSCREYGAFKNWICKITMNTCLDELRKRSGKTAGSLDEYLDEEHPERQIASGDPSPEQEYIRKEAAEYVQDAINRLPDDWRAVLLLRDIQELSYNEVADVTGYAIGTVKSKLFRARAALKELLLKEQKAAAKRHHL